MTTKNVKFSDSPPKSVSTNIKHTGNDLSQKNKKIEQLNFEKKKYIQFIYGMQSELFSLRKQVVNNSKLESQVKLYQNKCSNYEIEIKKLQNEILDLKSKYNDELRQKDNSYIEEIRKLKAENEGVKAKVGITNDLTREKNGLLKAFNIVLNEKNELAEEYDKNLRQKEINTQIKLTKLEKKMFDSVKETQSKANELNINYMNISSKLTLLQNHQFLIQLEYQEQELNNLIAKNELLEKKLTDLKKDIEIHKEVEISLAEKNKRLVQELNKLKNEENQENEKNEKNEEKHLSSNNSAINIGSGGEKKNNGSSSSRTIQLENKVINLEKKLLIKQKEYIEIKDKSDSFEKILKNYEKKYMGLFKFFEDCLTQFFKDEELKNNKDLCINIESMKKGDFSNLSDKEKYSILIILMKYLMPLIYSNESLNEFNILNNINLKFYSKMKKIKICRGNSNFNNINQNIFKKMMNKKGKINPDIISSNLKYNSFDDLPEISKRSPLSPLLSPRKISINLKKI